MWALQRTSSVLQVKGHCVARKEGARAGEGTRAERDSARHQSAWAQ